MDSRVKREVTDFLEKCDELKNCKFIMASSKIRDLLKSIANSYELYQLFSDVTRNFDYDTEKRRCLITVNDGISNRSYLVLPNTVGSRLALIFCLFVEFDKEIINFYDFLGTYFYEDGSYFSSFQSFCEKVVVPFEEIIIDAFSRELSAPDETEDRAGEQAEADPEGAERARYVSAISISVAREKSHVAETALGEDEKEAGADMLTEIETAARNEDGMLIRSLLCGYGYFLMYNDCVGEDFPSFEKLLTEYCELL